MYYWIILENIHTSPMDGYPVPGIQIVERRRKKKQGETRGGGNACTNSLAEFLLPLIDRRPCNCNMNYSLTELWNEVLTG